MKVHLQQHNPQSTIKKYYEIWQGKNIFFCKGKLMIGASIQPIVGTFLLINIPAFLEEFLVIRDYKDDTFAGILAGYIFIHLLTNIFLIKTVITDPGIIRRNNPEYVNSIDLSNIPSRKTDPKRKFCEMTVNGHFLKVKYCQTCHIYRPLRTSHCHDCDNCVERFDHHCPWLGTCIAKRNYRSFFFFVLCSTVLDIFTVGCSLHRILTILNKPDAPEVGAFLKSEPYTLISMIYGFLFIWFLAPLLVFHIWLIKNNQTTYEFWKDTWKKMGINPYKKKDFLTNYKNVMCLPIRGSFLRFREAVYAHEEKTTEPVVSKLILEHDSAGRKEKAKDSSAQLSMLQFDKQNESDKRSTPITYDYKDEHEFMLQNENIKTPPSKLASFKVEISRRGSQLVKGRVPPLNSNAFLFRMENEGGKENVKDTRTSTAHRDEFESEKSPLSGDPTIIRSNIVSPMTRNGSPSSRETPEKGSGIKYFNER